MSRRIILVALIVMFFVAVVVRADARMTNDAQRLGVYTPVAQSIYTPTCGAANVTIGTPPAVPGVPEPDGVAYQDGSCRIIVRPGLTDKRFCQVLVHEYGHLAGLAHDDTHPNIMDSHADVDVPACDAATDATLNDYDRALDLIPTRPVVFKAIRQNSPAYARGVRWVAYERTGIDFPGEAARWLIIGTGKNMRAEYAGQYAPLTNHPPR
jgi:hypothetical protein